MSFLCGFIWCVVALAACMLTRKYYVPYYLNTKKHTQTSSDDSTKDESSKDESTKDESTKESEPIVRSKILDNKTVRLVFYILVGVFAAVFGFFVFINTQENTVNNAQENIVNCAKISLCMLILFMVVVTDMELSVIPNLFVIILLLSRFVFLIFDLLDPRMEAWTLLLSNLVIAVIIVAFLIIMSVLTRGGLGAGDIKLYGAIAFLLNFSAVVFTLFIALLGASLLSIVLLIAKKKKIRDSFPMGPFICLGFGLTMILGLA